MMSVGVLGRRSVLLWELLLVLMVGLVSVSRRMLDLVWKTELAVVFGKRLVLDLEL